MADKLTELNMDKNWSMFYKSKENSFFLKVKHKLYKINLFKALYVKT